MRLPLVLLALAASMQPSHGLLHSRRSLATTYPACTAAQSKTFLDNLGAVSSGCANATSYAWDGDADPTSAQRTELCKCTVSALSVPKCHWTKLGQYDVSVSEHFNFAYNCSSISGKAVPKLTEVDAASYTPAPATTTAAPAETTEAAEAPTSTTEAPVSTTAAPSSQASTTGSDCTVSQLNAFTGALNTASSGCMSNSSYNWGGSADPTEAQYKEICKCAAVTAFTIPNCYIQKAQYRLLLSEHYNWVTGVQCPTFSPSTAVAETKSSSSSNVGLIAGIAGGIVAVVLVVVIGLFLYKRHRNEKEEEELQHYHQPHNDMNAMNATRQQVTYPQDFQQPYQQKRARPPVENINTI